MRAPTPAEPEREAAPCRLPQRSKAETLVGELGPAIVSGPGFPRVRIPEQSGAGANVQAADTEQTREKIGNRRDQKVIEVGRK